MAMLRQFPVFAILMLIASGMMLLPALQAASLRDWDVARAFLDHAVFFTLCAVILGIATMNRTPSHPARYHLLMLLLSYLLLPLMLAAPFIATLPNGIGDGYFEMLSCLTTTGATLFDRPHYLAEPLHLWRALIGWMGGLLILITAFAILAPLNLGGFEIGQAGSLVGASGSGGRRAGTVEEATGRILRTAWAIGPIYGALTAALWVLLMLAGDRPFIALCHAMATISTSGVSPVGGI